MGKSFVCAVYGYKVCCIYSLVGPGLKYPSGECTMLAQLDDPCRVCSSAIIDGISVLQAAVGKCYGVRLAANAHKTVRIDAPLVARAAISAARTELKAKLDWVVHETNKRAVPSRSTETQHRELFQKSLHSASLLHVRPSPSPEAYLYVVRYRRNLCGR